MPHLHPAYFLAALVGVIVGPVLSLPVATVIGSFISATGIVIAAWLQRKRSSHGK